MRVTEEVGCLDTFPSPGKETKAKPMEMKALRRGIAVLLASASVASAAGDWKNSPLHRWFDGLASKKGLCCSYADGVAISDVDWGAEVLAEPITLADGTQERNVYWVIVDGQKLIVPPDAVVVERNRYGQAVVWPFRDLADQLQIRCFMPGTEA
jgi:hypothetical protein